MNARMSRPPTTNDEEMRWDPCALCWQQGFLLELRPDGLYDKVVCPSCLGGGARIEWPEERAA